MADTETGAEPDMATDPGEGQGGDGASGSAGEDGKERSIEERAEDAEGLEEALGQMPIPGTGGKLTLSAGGNKPETSMMTMRGGSLPVEGEFPKGTRVRLWIEGVVSEVAFVDHIGKDGYVDGTIRRHTLRSVRVRRAIEDD